MSEYPKSESASRITPALQVDAGVEYFRDWDHRILAALPPMGMGGIYLWVGDDENWRFLAPQSDAWDRAHQTLYRNFRADALKPSELPDYLPPLPSSAPQLDFKPEDERLPRILLKAEQFPRVAAFLETQPQRQTTIVVLLFEDNYETSFGDGKFPDFCVAALPNEDPASLEARQRFIWGEAASGYTLHRSELQICLEADGTFGFPEFRVRPFEHFAPLQVLTSLEERWANP